MTDTTQDISKTEDEQIAEMIAADEAAEPQSLAELQAMPEPEAEVAPAVVAAPAKPTVPVEKTESRLIKKTICAWLRGMTEEQRKGISLETFKAKVLSVEPNWGIIAKGDKVVKTHLSWYKGFVKKHPVTDPQAPAASAPAPAAQA